MKELDKLILSKNNTIKEALTIIEKGDVKIAIVINGSSKVIGTVTDGDIKRGLLKALTLDSTIANLDLAKKLIDVAVNSGVDAVKFQTWKTELLVTKEAKRAEYQTKNTQIEESQFDMLKKLELSYDDFTELKEYCDKSKIIFLSTPDEIPSANFLADLQDIFKIGSGELTNLPYLKHIGGLGKK